MVSFSHLKQTYKLLYTDIVSTQLFKMVLTHQQMYSTGVQLSMPILEILMQLI